MCTVEGGTDSHVLKMRDCLVDFVQVQCTERGDLPVSITRAAQNTTVFRW